jgi:hypothetical protein
VLQIDNVPLLPALAAGTTVTLVAALVPEQPLVVTVTL